MSKKLSAQEARDVIVGWFKANPRPVSAQLLVDSTGSRFTPATAKKIFEELVQQGIIRQNEKGTLFWPVIDTSGLPDEETLSALRKDLELMNEEITEKRTTLGELSRLLAQATAEPTNKDLESIVQNTEREMASLTASLEERIVLSDGFEPPSDITRYYLDSYYRRVMSLWSRLKGTTLDMLAQISPDTPPLELMEQFGMESDESAGVSFKDLSKKFPPKAASRPPGAALCNFSKPRVSAEEEQNCDH